MKAQWDDSGGRKLLGDKTVGRAVILRQRSGSSVLEFGFQVDSSVCILALIDRMYIKLNSVALVRERTIPTERLPPVEGCHVVSATGPHGR